MFWGKKKQRRSRQDLEAVVSKVEAGEVDIDDEDLEPDEVEDVLKIVRQRSKARHEECTRKTDSAIENLTSSIRLPTPGPTENVG
jgi:hypothetical protein